MSAAAAVRKEIFLVTNGLHTDFQPGPLLWSGGGGGVHKYRLGEGARSRNRFLTSPLPATLWPQLVVAYSDNISANIKIPVHPGYPGSSHNRRGQNCDFVMILFFARDFDFNLSKLRQKQTPGDHKLAGTGPQWSVGALSHTEIREIILYGLKLGWKQTTCLVCVANNKNYWVLFLSLTCISPEFQWELRLRVLWSSS